LTEGKMKVFSANQGGAENIGVEGDKGLINFTAAFQAFQLAHCREVCIFQHVSDLLEAGFFRAEIFQEVLAFLSEHNLTGYFLFPGRVKLNPPLHRPPKILGIGRNYPSHAGDARPEEPIVFAKLPSAVIGPEEPILYRAGFTELNPEAELAVVIGRYGQGLLPAEAEKVIAGYSIMNDVTEVSLVRKDIPRGLPWIRCKSMDTFAPFGPCIVTPEEIGWPVALDIELRVNGQRIQNDNTRNMLFPVPELLAYISQYMSLEPGDVVTTGTPGGLEPIHPGDVVEITIEKIGTLRNPVVAA
jgi:2-keto-4-pentenoate hydratase/2-oxohepta-3-ene-1,7-dioic acid hydratase in catechol pathway